MSRVAIVLVAMLAFTAVASARQDEQLDSLLMNELQPVADPVPRLLAEALGEELTAGAYTGEPEGLLPDMPDTTAPEPIPTQTIPSTPTTATSGAGSAGAAAGLLAAAAVAVAML